MDETDVLARADTTYGGRTTAGTDASGPIGLDEPAEPEYRLDRLVLRGVLHRPADPL